MRSDRCLDRIAIHFKDTLMYVNPITRQTYDYATLTHVTKFVETLLN